MKINLPSEAPQWAAELVRDIERAIASPAESSMRLKGLASSDLPDAASAKHKFGIIFDKTAGRLKVSNGTDWEDVTPGSVPEFDGIKFPATQVPSSDPNTLDDYEEGIWTPQLRFGGASTGMTGTFGGRYTKTGRMVHLNGWGTLSAKGSSTGNATISGIPFASANLSGSAAIGSIIFGDGTMVNLVAPALYLASNSSTPVILNSNTTGHPSMNHNAFTDTSTFWFSLTYFT